MSAPFFPARVEGGTSTSSNPNSWRPRLASWKRDQSQNARRKTTLPRSRRRSIAGCRSKAAGVIPVLVTRFSKSTKRAMRSSVFSVIETVRTCRVWSSVVIGADKGVERMAGLFEREPGKRWPRSQQFRLSAKGAEAQATYREMLHGEREGSGGRSSFDSARASWAKPLALEPSDGLYLGELEAGPKTIEEKVQALDGCGSGRPGVQGAHRRVDTARRVGQRGRSA